MLTHREPVLIRAGIAALVALAVNLLDLGELDTDQVEAAVTVLTIMGTALWARTRVMPVHTIEQAGLSTDEIKADAADPRVTPLREREEDES